MIHGKIMMIALLLTGAFAAALAIAQMWWHPLAWDLFTKSLITLLIVGTIISFLVAVDYDLPGSRKKFMLGLLVLLALSGGGLIIAQMWWHILALALFGKVIVTMVIITILLAFVMAVSEDLGANKKLKDQKYID